jgi:hypothetical protein
MAVTPVGNPYVESSDNLADYPGASEALAERIDIVGVNPFANAAARDAAIPSPVQGQMCSLNDDNKGYRYDGSAWVLFSGAGDANFTNAATGTYTDGGIDYKYITFTASGELVVDKAGFADLLIVGGGGGGGAARGGGGGAGSHLSVTSLYLSAATHTIIIGAGGAGGSYAGVDFIGNNGIASSIGGFVFSPGGGGGGSSVELGTSLYLGSGLNGGSGGGASGGNTGVVSPGGAGISGLGRAGGVGNFGGVGGGAGGAGGVGGGAAGTTGGAGGAGASNSITGSAVTRCGGGGGRGTSTSGAAGSGGGGSGGVGDAAGGAGGANLGGGGGGTNGTAGGAGGSGVVIVRVVV